MIRLSPDREDAVSKALRAVAYAAFEATLPGELEAAKRALNAVWFAVHDARAAIDEAEKAERSERLAKLERTAA